MLDHDRIITYQEVHCEWGKFFPNLRLDCELFDIYNWSALKTINGNNISPLNSIVNDSTISLLQVILEMIRGGLMTIYFQA